MAKAPLAPEQLVDLTEVLPLLTELAELKTTIDGQKRRQKQIEDALKTFFRGSTSFLGGVVNRIPVITYKPTATFGGEAFRGARPDLAPLYTHQTVTVDLTALKRRKPDLAAAVTRALDGATDTVSYGETLDVEGLKLAHPQIHHQFCSRQLRLDTKALAAAQAAGSQPSVASQLAAGILAV